MFRYAFLSFILFAVLPWRSAYADDMFVFSVSDDTPASFFNSGIPTYFFRDGGIGVFRYSDKKLLYGMASLGDVSSIAEITPNVKDAGSADGLILSPDGSARFVRTREDYGCVDNPLTNCIYSDVVITGIEVRNLLGKADFRKISSEDEFKNGGRLRFPVGSKMYIFSAVSPAYDFNEFDDFDSLVCSKNEDGECRTVVSDGILDMAALFELYHGAGELEGVVFGDAGKDGLAYVYDIEKMTVTPYSMSCLEKTSSVARMAECSRAGELPVGEITENIHESGLVYWSVDYKNPSVDNLIFWINDHDEPFKVRTNPYSRTTFKMYNETAAQTVFKAL